MSKVQLRTPPPKLEADKPGSFWKLGCLVVLALLLAGAVAGGWFIVKSARQWIAQFTSETGESLPVVQLEEPQMKSLQRRLYEFNTALSTTNTGTQAVSLSLSSEELNGLLHREHELRGKVYLQMTNGLISGRVSVPLDRLAIPFLDTKGRFLNGDVQIAVGVSNHQAAAFLKDLSVNGKRMPDQLFQSLSGSNLLHGAIQDTNILEVLKRLKTLKVEGDRLVGVANPVGKASSASD